MKEERPLTIPQAAEELGVTTETVKNYIRKDIIRARSVGGCTMIDHKSYDNLFDDLSDLAEMGRNIKLLKGELIAERKSRAELLGATKETNDILGIVRQSNIGCHLIHMIVRSMGNDILTEREACMMCRFLECADARLIAREYVLRCR